MLTWPTVNMSVSPYRRVYMGYDVIAHLHQQLVSGDPLHRLDHQVAQSLFLLVLTHVVLSGEPKEQRNEQRKEQRERGTIKYMKHHDLENC